MAGDDAVGGEIGRRCMMLRGGVVEIQYAAPHLSPITT